MFDPKPVPLIASGVAAYLYPMSHSVLSLLVS